MLLSDYTTNNTKTRTLGLSLRHKDEGERVFKFEVFYMETQIPY